MRSELKWGHEDMAAPRNLQNKIEIKEREKKVNEREKINPPAGVRRECCSLTWD
jgi:hypothetical protein